MGASFVKTILDMNSTTPLSMDSGLVAAAYGAGSISPSFLRAVCAALGSNASHSALVTTRSSIMQVLLAFRVRGFWLGPGPAIKMGCGPGGHIKLGSFGPNPELTISMSFELTKHRANEINEI